MKQITGQIVYVLNVSLPIGSQSHIRRAFFGYLKDTNHQRPQKVISHPTRHPERISYIKWFLQHYQASAFNTCSPAAPVHDWGTSHDRIQRRTCCPHLDHCALLLKLLLKEVKGGIDRKVELRIMESVPQGTPTVCCLRMVVTRNRWTRPHCKKRITHPHPFTTSAWYCQTP